MEKEEKIARLWMFQVIIKDRTYPHNFPELQILVKTIKNMKSLIVNYWRNGFQIKIQKCKKMNNIDWLYMIEYERWWNDTNLITPKGVKE